MSDDQELKEISEEILLKYKQHYQNCLLRQAAWFNPTDAFTAHVLARIARAHTSCTACYFDLSEHIVPCPGSKVVISSVSWMITVVPALVLVSLAPR